MGNVIRAARPKYKASRHSPSQERSRERVRIILASASHLFNTLGIEKTTTNAVAKHAGLPVGSVYKYFHDKRAIIYSLYELFTADLAAHIRSAINDPLARSNSAEGAVDVLYGEWLTYVQANRLSAIRSFLYSDPSWSADAAKLEAVLIDAIEELITCNAPGIQDSRIKALLLYRLAIAYEEIFNLTGEQADHYSHYARRAACSILSS